MLSTKAYTAKVAALLLAAHALTGTYEQGDESGLAAAAGLCDDADDRTGSTRCGRVARARLPPASTSS